jgi:endonuclease/exonuclease/phosphatase family metal-dependent hydrolase
MRIVATHLGLSFRERRDQVCKLLAMLGSRDGPTLAMGDFNDWFWVGSVRRNLARALPACSRHRTFPSAFPLFALDGIYLWPAGSLVGTQTDRAARTLSDHLPVIADIDLARVESSIVTQSAAVTP